MFDESFGRSKLYFTTLQMLRIFFDLIHEHGQELRDASLYNFDQKHYDPAAIKSCGIGSEEPSALAALWKDILRVQQARGKGLLARIASKTAEIESLRDGVQKSLQVLPLRWS